jgi:hypothetical protein
VSATDAHRAHPLSPPDDHLAVSGVAWQASFWSECASTGRIDGCQSAIASTPGGSVPESL